MSKQVSTVLIIGIAVLVGFEAGCGLQEPTALEQTPAIEQTSVAGRLQAISSDKSDSEIKSPGSDPIVPKPANRPAGQCCFANCGDGHTWWYNLRWVDENCNHYAAKFCASQGWSFINAEWWPC